MIDPASGWFEIHQYKDKQAITVANITEQEWLSRYPWPTQITFDRGNKFNGHAFRHHSQMTMASNVSPSQSEIHKQML